MNDVLITPCSIRDLEASPNADTLFDEYAAESAVEELGPTVRPDGLGAYKALEDSGALHMLGAFRGGKLIGFMTIIVSTVPHFGDRTVAISESIFVSPAERRGGVGTKLLKAAESMAEQCGACGLVVSAPSEGRLAKVLPRSGFRETSRVFFRGIA